MAHWIRNHVLEAIRQFGLDASEMGTRETETVRELVESRYAGPGKAPLWERLTKSQGVFAADCWRRVAGLVDKDEVTLFFDSDYESSSFRVADGATLGAILGECPGMVFYVTDQSTEYVLCCNDHDYLIGAGRAANWIAAQGSA